MSVKKLLILAAAGVASLGAAAAMAGGPDIAPEPVDSYFYIEGSLGYAFQDFTWQAGSTNGIPLIISSAAIAATDNVTGGLAYGADLGYMFNHHFGLEVGWTSLPRFGNQLQGPGNNPNLPIVGLVALRDTWGGWLAVKAVAPLTENFDLFFKAGVTYRAGNLTFNHLPAAKVREVRPLVAIGSTYHFMEDWMMSVQYMHFMGGTSYSSFNPNLSALIGPGGTAASVVMPSSNVVTASVGYKFMV